MYGKYRPNTKLHILTNENIYVKSKEATAAIGQLNIKNISSEFYKFSLPFYTDGPATFYMSFGAPNTAVPEHSHDEGDGITIIMF
jgi:hypothetical protein